MEKRKDIAKPIKVPQSPWWQEKLCTQKTNFNTFLFYLLIWLLTCNGEMEGDSKTNAHQSPWWWEKLQPPLFSLLNLNSRKVQEPPDLHLCPTPASLMLHPTLSINSLCNEWTKRLISVMYHEFLWINKKNDKEYSFLKCKRGELAIQKKNSQR